MSIKSTRILKIAAAAFAVAIAGAAIPGAVTPAEAKKIVFVKKHFHHGYGFRHYAGPAFIVAGVGAYAASQSCYGLKVRALRTGSAYWWDRYNDCIGE